MICLLTPFKACYYFFLFLVCFVLPHYFIVFKIQFYLARPMERTVLTVSAG
jgi:hypothetical protein